MSYISYLCFFVCVLGCPTYLDYMSHVKGVLKEAGTAYLLRAPGFIRVFGGSVLQICLVFCVECVFVFALFVFVLFLVYPMFLMSLDCPSLIVPSVFSNVYVLHIY